MVALSIMRAATGAAGVSCDRDGKVAIWPLTGMDVPSLVERRDVDIAAASAGPESVSVLLRETSGIERWVRGPDDELSAWPWTGSGSASGVRVTGTVDAGGDLWIFRADLDLRSSAPEARRRPIRLQPYRALAVGDVEGELTTLALRADGGLEVYGPDGTRSRTVETGIDIFVSISLGRTTAGVPVVTCGDTDGCVLGTNWATGMSRRHGSWAKQTPARRCRVTWCSYGETRDIHAGPGAPGGISHEPVTPFVFCRGRYRLL